MSFENRSELFKFASKIPENFVNSLHYSFHFHYIPHYIGYNTQPCIIAPNVKSRNRAKPVYNTYTKFRLRI